MRRKLVAGNWKMNGSLAANAVLLNEIVTGLMQAKKSNAAVCDIAVCVPFPYLVQCQEMLSSTALALGAQDVSAHDTGAYTGETSACMLQEFDCRYVIVGHSERRAYCAESDVMVAAKAVAALRNGLIPVVCVGETLAQREAGQTAMVVRQQMEVVLTAVLAAELTVTPAQALEKIVIAYEPVWAIGTGNTATPQMAQEVHAILRAQLKERDAVAAEKIRILYGGSMKADNARELLAMMDIDGGLIGGASLKSADFLAIIHAASAIE